MKLEDTYRIQSLKSAALVLNEMAKTFKDVQVQQDIKSLVWSISWAVTDLEKYKQGDVD